MIKKTLFRGISSAWSHIVKWIFEIHTKTAHMVYLSFSDPFHEPCLVFFLLTVISRVSQTYNNRNWSDYQWISNLLLKFNNSNLKSTLSPPNGIRQSRNCLGNLQLACTRTCFGMVSKASVDSFFTLAFSSKYFLSLQDLACTMISFTQATWEFSLVVDTAKWVIT